VRYDIEAESLEYASFPYASLAAAEVTTAILGQDVVFQSSSHFFGWGGRPGTILANCENINVEF
jgi:hypothetical protein